MMNVEQPPDPRLPIPEAFALMLETACEDFESLQHFIRREIKVNSTEEYQGSPRHRSGANGVGKILRLSRGEGAAALQTKRRGAIGRPHRTKAVSECNQAARCRSRCQRARILAYSHISPQNAPACRLRGGRNVPGDTRRAKHTDGPA